MGWLLLCLGCVLAAVALFLLRGAERRWAQSGLPRVRLVYVDERDWRRSDALLRSARYRLVGRPDYLLEHHGRKIPVEVKPGRSTGQPYLGDLLQLASYGLLLEEATGQRAPYGILRYSNATFQVFFDRPLTQRLLELLEEMARAREAHEVPRNHKTPARCAACGLRYACGPWALA